MDGKMGSFTPGFAVVVDIVVGRQGRAHRQGKAKLDAKIKHALEPGQVQRTIRR